VTVTCDVMLIPNPKFKNKKIIENKMKMKKEMKINKVYYLQFWHILLWSQDLGMGQEKESCIGFTQENSIESSVQDCMVCANYF